jgi:manganese/zinc/iron transport system substrate-binding protein
MLFKLLTLLIILLLLPITTAASTYSIACTTGMIGDLAREIAGPHARVTVLMGPGVDPHVYVANRDDLVTLRQADVILYNGHRLEGRLTDTLQRLGNRKTIAAVAELLPADHQLRDPDSGAVDPHAWMDASVWAEVASIIATTLGRHDPANATAYQANATRVAAKLMKLHAQITASVATIPEPQRILLTAHDAFGYFGRAYQMEVRGIQGYSTESEAGLREINALVDLVVQRRIPAVFVESSVSEKNVRALVEGARSRGHELRVGGTLFSDALGPADSPGATYTGMIRHNAATITRALGGTPSEELAP